MLSIQRFINATALPAALKEELAGDQILGHHALHLNLPAWLAPVFGGVVPEKLEALALSSYLYFRFMLVVDSLIDGLNAGGAGAQLRPAAGPVDPAERLLTYCHLFEHSVRGLATLFPAGDPFWADLDSCKRQFAASDQLEKALSAAHSGFTQAVFEQLAADKAAVCNAVVYALSRLSRNPAPVAALLRCLHHLHVALQCMDDVADFVPDWQLGQYTYAHALVEQYLLSLPLDVSALDAAQVRPFLYTSGVATQLYELAEQHFDAALVISRSFGLDSLTGLLEQHKERSVLNRADITRALAQAQARVPAASVAVA